GVNFTQAGSSSLQASAGALSGSPVTFAVTTLAAPTSTADIDVGNNFFQPSTITVPAGSLVRWTFRNPSGVAHNVTSSGDPGFASSSPQITGDGSTFTQLLGAPGTYRYECTLHGGMNATIIVQ